tara:strand:- start:31538 stop:31726 length:189 start_codon:yes stop_codon:yes gene_type:complete
MREKVNIPVRFPNESYAINVPIDLDEFEPKQSFDEVTFGWWGGIFVNIENKYLPENKLIKES